MDLLSKHELEKLNTEIHAAIEANKEPIKGYANKEICQNKEMIIAFLEHLASLIPGFFGKVVAKLVVAAANAWFEKECPSTS